MSKSNKQLSSIHCSINKIKIPVGKRPRQDEIYDWTMVNVVDLDGVIREIGRETFKQLGFKLTQETDCVLVTREGFDYELRIPNSLCLRYYRSERKTARLTPAVEKPVVKTAPEAAPSFKEQSDPPKPLKSLSEAVDNFAARSREGLKRLEDEPKKPKKKASRRKPKKNGE